MGLRYRKRLSLGPLRVNISRSGVSLAAKVGPVTRNFTRRTTWVNGPGGFFWTKKDPPRN